MQEQIFKTEVEKTQKLQWNVLQTAELTRLFLSTKVGLLRK